MKLQNIIIEGIDGSGKSTQAKLLEQYLKNDISKPAKLYREPGGTVSAEYVRSILKDTKIQLSDKQKLSLFCIARKFLCDELLTKYSEDSNFISILDRFIPSTYAYQVYGCGLEREYVDQVMTDICSNYIDVYKKSVVIYIDVDPEITYNRLLSRNNKMDDPYEKLDFLKKVYNGYNEYFNDRKDVEIFKIDGNRDVTSICNDIINYVKWNLI